MSRPTTIHFYLHNRKLHLMSQPEVWFALLALYHPRLIDLHEQKMLHPLEAPHPLDGFPGYEDLSWPYVRGTLDVAQRQGWLNKHPRIFIPNPAATKKALVAFPYQGDLLLIFELTEPPYLTAVNWSIKKDESDFEEPNSTDHAQMEKWRAKLHRRNSGEETYYQDVDIPTCRLGQNELSADVIGNLRVMYPSVCETSLFSQDAQSSIRGLFELALHDGVPPCEVVVKLSVDYKYSVSDIHAEFHRLIWRRQLRVDLLSPVVMDAPMRKEHVDLLDVYKEWYAPAGIAC